MQRVEEPMETIHLYVVREKEKRPYSLLPLFCAFFCLVAMVALTLYSGEHPFYERETLRIPAVFLPLKTFTASIAVVPTGIKTYPAIQAHGLLTITNGSIISQDMPKGMFLIANNGVEVVIDTDVFVPAGSVNGYGFATVSAHAMVAGKSGDIPAYALDRVEGSSIYIRNLSPFIGGRDASSVKVATSQDKQRALDQARTVLARSVQIKAILASPCREVVSEVVKVVVKWQCQFVTFHVPTFMHVAGVSLVGKNLFVDVVFVPLPVLHGGK